MLTRPPFSVKARSCASIQPSTVMRRRTGRAPGESPLPCKTRRRPPDGPTTNLRTPYRPIPGPNRAANAGRPDVRGPQPGYRRGSILPLPPSERRKHPAAVVAVRCRIRAREASHNGAACREAILLRRFDPTLRRRRRIYRRSDKQTGKAPGSRLFVGDYRPEVRSQRPMWAALHPANLHSPRSEIATIYRNLAAIRTGRSA